MNQGEPFISPNAVVVQILFKIITCSYLSLPSPMSSSEKKHTVPFYLKTLVSMFCLSGLRFLILALEGVDSI